MIRLLLLACVLSAGTYGCDAAISGDDSSDDTGDDSGDDTGDDDTGDDGDDVGADGDGDGIKDTSDNCPRLANADQADTDADTYGDECDCDPGDATEAADLVVEDSLATAGTRFTPATGFAAASWSYTTGAYRQTRLVNDGSDASFYSGTENLTDVIIEATVASTAIQGFDATDLRQLMFIARAESSAAKFAGAACGIEVVEGLTPTQKTTTMTMGGIPAAVTGSPINRTNRASIVENEEIKMRMMLKGGDMTCTVTLDGTDVTTATATNVAQTAGKVGFYTRETKALFKNLKICSYRP